MLYYISMILLFQIEAAAATMSGDQEPRHNGVNGGNDSEEEVGIVVNAVVVCVCSKGLLISMLKR